MKCQGCGKDISVEGAQNCSICDPDMMKIMTREVAKKCPNLCSVCFKAHVDAHGGVTSSAPPSAARHCTNCGSNSFSGDTCFQCGGSPRIG
ncbi:MAG: hypothetical protein AAB455_03655 [Patescibacteria group bacterium]